MDENEVQRILIEILYATIHEVENNDLINSKLTPELLLSIYRLAKKHDLAHVVSKFVYSNRIEIDQELQELLKREEIVSVYRHEQMKYAYGKICSAFDETEIAYIPLKGSVIRPYYPYESMRKSCDIDILIHEEDLERALNALEARGFLRGNRGYHDVSLYSPNKILLELHFSIQENRENLDAVLKDAWKYAVLTGGFRYAFSKEFFVFHIFSHMAYHFLSGGCGIRSLLDIWIMEHKMEISYTCAKELLKKAGIYRFAMEMSRLAEQCFTHNNRDVFADSVLNYIFQGGVYGSAENHIAVDKSKNNGSVFYVLRRLFLPYKSMIITYPFLKKIPVLLPVCWVIRWINVLYAGKSKRVVSELSCANNMSAEKIEEVTAICSRLGL